MIPAGNFFASKENYLECQDHDSSDDEYKNDEVFKKNNDEEIGNLSPIGYMKDEVDDIFDTGY